MIYTDKTEISDAVGCTYAWSEGGAPEEVVLDRGAKYVSDDAYEILAALGITNLGCPAGKPWLKPFIERVFQTIHTSFLARFSGRTFSNVVQKGENKPAERASLGLDDFLYFLVRWIVDGYHNMEHSALGITPRQAWQIAYNECEPRSISSQEMRLAFGTRLTRNVGPRGVRVKHIDYQIDQIAAARLNMGLNKVEVARWQGDIGTIDVREGDGEWVTVSAANERWIGKTDLDLDMWLKARKNNDPDARKAYLEVVDEIDKASYQMKKLCGLITLPMSEADLEKAVAEHKLHIDTAERRYQFGAYEGLLDNSVTPEKVSVTAHNTNDGPGEDFGRDSSIDKLME